jgi:hypothetical protein
MAPIDSLVLLAKGVGCLSGAVCEWQRAGVICLQCPSWMDSGDGQHGFWRWGYAQASIAVAPGDGNA